MKTLFLMLMPVVCCAHNTCSKETDMVNSRDDKTSPDELFSKVPLDVRNSVKGKISNLSRAEAIKEARGKFNVAIYPDAWTIEDGCDLIVSDDYGHYKFNSEGKLIHFQVNSGCSGKECDMPIKELEWFEKRQKELELSKWGNSNVVAKIVQEVRDDSKKMLNNIRGRRILGSRRTNNVLNGIIDSKMLLEPLMPLKDAILLAKKGDPKGYYQLAMRYSAGDELPDNNKTAIVLLNKAVEGKYPNAVFVDALLYNGLLADNLGMGFTIGGCKKEIEVFFGSKIFLDRRSLKDSQSELYEKVKKKYEMASRLGIAQAKLYLERIEGVYERTISKKEAERKGQERRNNNHVEVANVLGDLVKIDSSMSEFETDAPKALERLRAIQDVLRRQREQKEHLR